MNGANYINYCFTLRRTFVYTTCSVDITLGAFLAFLYRFDFLIVFVVYIIFVIAISYQTKEQIDQYLLFHTSISSNLNKHAICPLEFNDFNHISYKLIAYINVVVTIPKRRGFYVHEKTKCNGFNDIKNLISSC